MLLLWFWNDFGFARFCCALQLLGTCFWGQTVLKCLRLLIVAICCGEKGGMFAAANATLVCHSQNNEFTIAFITISISLSQISSTFLFVLNFRLCFFRIASDLLNSLDFLQFFYEFFLLRNLAATAAVFGRIRAKPWARRFLFARSCLF